MDGLTFGSLLTTPPSPAPLPTAALVAGLVTLVVRLAVAEDRSCLSACAPPRALLPPLPLRAPPGGSTGTPPARLLASRTWWRASISASDTLSAFASAVAARSSACRSFSPATARAAV